MTKSTKIVYEHLKDYPTSTEGFREISAPAVAAAVRSERATKTETRDPQPPPREKK